MNINKKYLFLITVIISIILLTSVISAADTNKTTNTKIDKNNEIIKDTSLNKDITDKSLKTAKSNSTQKETKKSIKKTDESSIEHAEYIPAATQGGYKKNSVNANIKKDTNIKAKVLSNKAANTTFKVTITSGSYDYVESGVVNVYKNNKIILKSANVTNGIAIIQLTQDTGNNQKFTFKYMGDDSYYPSKEVSRTINIYKSDTKTKATILSNKVANTSFKISVTSNNMPVQSGQVQLINKGEILSVSEVSNGVAILNTTASAGNNKKYRIQYTGNNNYKPSNITRTINIYKSETNTKVTVLSNKATNTSFKITLTTLENNLVKSGQVRLYNRGKLISTAKVTNGYAYITTTQPVTKNKVYKFYYLGDNTYKPSNTTRTVSIYKTDTTIKAKVLSNNVEDTAFQVTVKTKDGKYVQSGNINVLNSKGSTITTSQITDGIANIYLVPTAGNNKKYTFKYTGDNTYNPSNTTRTINVCKIKTSIKVETLKATTQNTSFKVTIENDGYYSVDTGKINIYDNNDNLLASKQVNSQVTYIQITTTEGNNKKFKIRYMGSTNYYSSNTVTKTVNVVDSSKIPMFISVESVIASPNTETWINPEIYKKIKIGYEIENLIEYDSNDIEVYINNQLIKTTSSDYEISGVEQRFTTPSTVGKYSLTVKYKGNDEYQSCSVTVPLIVKECYDGHMQLYNHLLDLNNPESCLPVGLYIKHDNEDMFDEGYIDYYFNNKYVGRKYLNTESYSMEFTPPSTAGYYTAKAIYYDDLGNYILDASSLYYVGKIGLYNTISFNDTYVYTNNPITVSTWFSTASQYGQPYTLNGYVDYYFNNRYIRTDYLTGYEYKKDIKLNAPSTAGTYTFKAVYSGSEYFKDATYTETITVKSQPVKITIKNDYITKGETLTATVKEGNNNVDSGKVTFYKDSTYLGSATVSNGKASIKFSNFYDNENILITAKYKPIENEYEEATTTKTVKYDEGITSYIIAHPVYGNPYSTVDISAQLKHEDNSYVHRQQYYRDDEKITLKYYLNGEYIGSTTDYCCEKQYFYYTMPSYGTYNLTIKYVPSDASLIRSTSYTTKLISTYDEIYDLKVYPSVGPHNNTILIGAYVYSEDYETISSGKIKFYMDDKLIKTVNVKYNYAEFYYKTPSTKGLHKIKAVYVDRYNDEVVVDEHLFKVGVDNAKITIDLPEQIRRGYTYTITATVDVDDYSDYNTINNGNLKFYLPDDSIKTAKVKDSQASITFYVPYTLDVGEYMLYIDYDGTKYYPYTEFKRFVEVV